MPATAKRDRTARLLRVEHLLYQHPRGLKPAEIAHLCGVCRRTAYRDLLALQAELQLPIWQDGEGRYGIEGGHFLPPVKFTLLEATSLFIAARLACQYTYEHRPGLESAFAKLATVLPPALARHVQETVAELCRRPHNDTFAQVFDLLAMAWARGQRVKIWYERGVLEGHPEVVERLLDPYFLEPSAARHACYVIGLDHRSEEVRTFKLERIRDIELTAEEYTLPETWSAADYLRNSWGIVHDEEVEVKARFSPAVAARVKEAIWHPSQTLEEQEDGGLLFTVRVAGSHEIARWLHSWGEDVEVLAPPELREHFAAAAKQLGEIYFPTSLPSS